jgi:1,4-dihydroxy-2-naphthoate octaprenyltransferase
MDEPGTTVHPPQAGEPQPDRLRHWLPKLFFATRPAFLSVTGAGVVLGLSCAYYDVGRVDWFAAAMTFLFALVAHSGINVVNDYFDALNGTDDCNVERIFPFTGGSRFIQNGVLTAAQTRSFGYALLATVVPAGLVLTAWSGPGLVGVGLLGLSIGWAYSAPPLKLNSRGLGEFCVTAGFLLVVVGTDYVQRGAFYPTPFAAGLPYALLVTNVLFINQFPDRNADIAAGKLHWVARLETRSARWVYLLIAALSAVSLLACVLFGWLPGASLAGLVALLPANFAARELLRYAGTPGRLAPAIKATIAAALVSGVVLSLALALSR